MFWRVSRLYYQQEKGTLDSSGCQTSAAMALTYTGDQTQESLQIRKRKQLVKKSPSRSKSQTLVELFESCASCWYKNWEFEYGSSPPSLSLFSSGVKKIGDVSMHLCPCCMIVDYDLHPCCGAHLGHDLNNHNPPAEDHMCSLCEEGSLCSCCWSFTAGRWGRDGFPDELMQSSAGSPSQETSGAEAKAHSGLPHAPLSLCLLATCHLIEVSQGPPSSQHPNLHACRQVRWAKSSKHSFSASSHLGGPFISLQIHQRYRLRLRLTLEGREWPPTSMTERFLGWSVCQVNQFSKDSVLLWYDCFSSEITDIVEDVSRDTNTG